MNLGVKQAVLYGLEDTVLLASMRLLSLNPQSEGCHGAEATAARFQAAELLQSKTHQAGLRAGFKWRLASLAHGQSKPVPTHSRLTVTTGLSIKR